MKIEKEIDNYVVFLAFCQVLCYNDKIEMEAFIKFLLSHWKQLDLITQKNCKWEVMNILYDIDQKKIRQQLNYTQAETDLLRQILDQPFSTKTKQSSKKKSSAKLVL